jgi:hypothetical protein
MAVLSWPLPGFVAKKLLFRFIISGPNTTPVFCAPFVF